MITHKHSAQPISQWKSINNVSEDLEQHVIIRWIRSNEKSGNNDDIVSGHTGAGKNEEDASKRWVTKRDTFRSITTKDKLTWLNDRGRNNMLSQQSKGWFKISIPQTRRFLGVRWATRLWYLWWNLGNLAPKNDVSPGITLWASQLQTSRDGDS